MALPSEGLSAQSEVDMELRSKDADWQPQTICGLQVADLKQVSPLTDVQVADLKQVSPLTEVTLKNNEKPGQIL